MNDPRVQKTADWCRHWGDVHGVDDMEAVAQLIERLTREKAEAEEKLHWKVISHIQADERIEELQAKVEELKRINENHCKAHLMSINKIDELETALALLDKNNFQHAKPYMVCVPTEVWRKVFPALKEELYCHE